MFSLPALALVAAAVVTLALAAVLRRRHGAGRASFKPARGMAAPRLAGLDLESPPADEPMPSPPPSPPAGGAEDRLDELVSEDDLLSMFFEDNDSACMPSFDAKDAWRGQHELPPATEEQPSGPSCADGEAGGAALIEPRFLAKYRFDGIPMFCEGASAGEPPLGRSLHDELPTGLVSGAPRVHLKRPLPAEADGSARARARAFDPCMGAPSVELEGCLIEGVDDRMLRDVIEAEVNEASNCWDAAPACWDERPAASHAAMPPAEERTASRAAWPPSAADGRSDEAPSHAVESGCSSHQHQAQPPAGDSPQSGMRSFAPAEPHWSEAIGTQPPAGESPLHSSAQPGCASAYANSAQVLPLQPHVQQQHAQLASLASQLELAQRLQELSHAPNLPSHYQLQELLRQGVDPALVQQLAQLAQLAQLVRVQHQLAPLPLPLPPAPWGVPAYAHLLAEQCAPNRARAPPNLAPTYSVYGMPSRPAHGARAPPLIQPTDLQMMGSVQAMQCIQHPHLPRLSAAESQQLLQLWMQHVDEVSALAEKRRTHLVFERHSHRHFCQGCGRSKAGHKRSEVHSKCVDPVCWCGIKRMLHPATLSSGARCLGEWRDVCTRRVAPQDGAPPAHGGAPPSVQPAPCAATMV
ncbi:hypothetical protein KFE25_008972 [Diacronema lutheri]|uniref:Uncharacterized protein n=2 Tax=Diacronema lutheri TaxID=2081491 RepID=A0A8J5XWX1_DIALT|nr:hypothetical protein KFE25_008972 [Diacronema lutheri]